MDFWDFVWGSLVVFFFAMFLVVFVSTLIDVLLSHDLSGGKKALWVIFLIVLPVVGVLAYVVIRGPGMAERRMKAQAQQAEVIASMGRSGAAGPADQLATAKGLLDSGAIDQDEYNVLKAKILA